MIYTPLTKKALKLCFEAHKDQTDKTGLPYVFHPFHLAEQMTDEYTTVVALLHDVVEDTEYTLNDLKEMGYPDKVMQALTLLTHDDGSEYMDYIALADLKHNSELSRYDMIDSHAIKRTAKYKQAIEFLSL